MLGSNGTTAIVAAVLVFSLLGSLAFVATPDATPQTESNDTHDDDGIERVHAEGVTGENVSIAILDPTGFDTDDAAYADAVAAAEAFGSGASVGPDEGDTHGTQAAREVAEAAPDAALYLGAFDGEDGYGRAMAWAVREDVDVVVVPASFQGKRDDGNSTVENVTERAVERGVVVVTAAGNTARGHWSKRYVEVRGDALVVEDGVRNYLRGDGTVVRAWVSWDRAHAEEDYTLELYRVAENGPRLVAESVPYEADDVPNERLNVRVERGTHFLVVRGPDRPTGAEVAVTTTTHRLQHVTVQGSIVAPASATGVLAVGAWNPAQNRLAAYSASGPTGDGRVGVDVVAPARSTDEFYGSSVAAARTGGLAALVVAANPEASPSDVERIVERAARDVGRAGPDLRTGYGRVRPERTVEAALDAARNDSTTNATTNRVDGQHERLVRPREGSARATDRLAPAALVLPAPPLASSTRTFLTSVPLSLLAVHYRFTSPESGQ